MAIDHLIIHDERLVGCFQPTGRTQLYVVNGSTRIARISDIICNAARMHGRKLTTAIPTLSLFAHGVEVCADDRGRDSGLQFGREYLHSGNSEDFGRSIRGRISEKIRVVGCAIASTEDGRSICRQLAVGAQVTVFASSSVQQYGSRYTEETEGDVTVHNIRSSRFGRWQGTVYEFRRDGTHRVAWRNGDDIRRRSSCANRPAATGEASVVERMECLPNQNVHHI